MLTLYTSSTENWWPPEKEDDFLMNLAEKYAMNGRPNLQQNGIRLQLKARRQVIYSYLFSTTNKTINLTKGDFRLFLNLAFNYGGVADTINGMKGIILGNQNGLLVASKMDWLTFSPCLYCLGTPDEDSIGRTSSVYRLSCLLRWLSPSTVFVSEPVFLPDFQ